MLLISLLTVQLQTKVPNMAYGSIKSISDSILESTDGESIQEQIDAYMQSTTSGTTNDGVIANAAIRKDTGAIVKSLGARAKAKAEPAVLIDKAASVSRDWTALMMANDQDNSAINAAFLSDEIAANASSAPETTDEAFLQTGVLPAGGDTGNGLMSSLRPEARPAELVMSSLRPEARPDVVTEEPEAVVPTSTTFATITKSGTSTIVDSTAPLTNGFDSLTLAEGTNIHLDGRGFVTLPHGIVPDTNSIKKADGTAFNPTGSHGLKRRDLSGVDYSGATKFGISRTDYADDEAWAKAVYAEFGDRTATEYGTGFVDLTDSAKQAAYDMTWNAGIASASWSSVQTMLTEASKEDDTTKSTDNLIGFTTNFRSGKEKVNGVSVNNYPRGLLKRRAQTYNLVAKSGEEASTITTIAVMTNGVRTGTTYQIKKSDGTIIKTWTKPDLNERLGDLEIN